jgi:arylsulfatase A-like enzyme
MSTIQRMFTFNLILICYGTLVGCHTSTHTKPSPRPNIVLVMADDQGWGDMGYTGHAVVKTPHFDAMSREALRFDRFYAAAPVCSPTRASVLTGRHPNRMGCFKWGNSIRPQENTIAEVLYGAGYATGHFGKWHLGTTLKNSPVSPGANGFDTWLSAPNFYDNNATMSRNGVAEKMEGESSMIAVDTAIDFMRAQVKQNKPFLSVVWFGSPHNPHIASEKERAPYADQESPKKMDHFLGELAGMDTAFGKLRQELRDLGIHENTILWYCSDNGGLPKYGRTGGRGHKGQVWEGGLRVPAMIEWPAQIPRNPAPVNMPSNTVDIYPTLLDIVQVFTENQAPLDGISLMPLIKGNMSTRPRGMGFWDYNTKKGTPVRAEALMQKLLALQADGKEITDPVRLRMDAHTITTHYPENTFPGHSAWLVWPWKLHRIEKEGNVSFELYNLKDDPMEQYNQITNETEQVKNMKQELNQWLVSVVRSTNGADY